MGTITSAGFIPYVIWGFVSGWTTFLLG